MKTLWQRLPSAMIAALFALALVALPASADDSAAEPFSIQASLLTPSKITLGEPILVRYKLTNASPQKVVTHLGIYGTDWYTLTMRDIHGDAVPLIPDPRPAQPQGVYSSKSGFFREGVSDTDYILVTKRLAIQHPGQYTLIIHAKLPYVTGDDLDEGTPEASAADSGLTQTQDITIPILVTDADPIRLQATAENLRKASIDGQNGQLALANMDALFSMPEAQAAASWQSLAFTPSMFTDAVIGELAELHSTTGVDILAQMLDNPKLTRSSISVSINKLYNAGTPALRDHIKAVANLHGFEMPAVAGTPFVPKDEEHSTGGVTF